MSMTCCGLLAGALCLSLGALGASAQSQPPATAPAVTPSPDAPKMPPGDWPFAMISNGPMTARVLVPNAENGFYRGTRFDWSGMVYSVDYAGHHFFGYWKNDRHTGLVHDDVLGTAEEFSQSAPPGFAGTKPGDTFMKIGVGELKRLDEKPYAFNGNYSIVQSPPWQITHGQDWIEFHQKLTMGRGLGYDYVKRIELGKGGLPTLTITRKLTNTGTQPIETDHYGHNFILIDQQPVGPDYSVKFSRSITTQPTTAGVGQISGNTITFTRLIPQNNAVFSRLAPMPPDAKGYSVTVLRKPQDAPTGQSVTISGTDPLIARVFYGRRWAACPEPFIAINVPPGQSQTWTTKYTFNTADPGD